MAKKLRGGIDLGGTKIQVVIVDADHEVRGKARAATPIAGGPEAIVAAMANAVAEAAREADVAPEDLRGVGVGSPGAIDAAEGTISHAGNLDGWRERAVPVASLLEGSLRTPISLGNDVDVATKAEFELGAAKEFRSVIGVFWGTGVGGGVILDGHQWDGRGSAGEIGHVCVQHIDGELCGCGRRGCMEAYAGRGRMEAAARAAVAAGETTRLFEIMQDRGKTRLASGVWQHAAEEGDALAVRILDRALAALGAGVASVVNVLDVEGVILGGGLGTRFGQEYADRLAERMQPHLFRDDTPPTVRVARLGDLGGAIGASLLVHA